MKVILSRAARRDLQEIIRYLSRLSPSAARRLNSAIRSKVRSLRRDAKRGFLIQTTGPSEIRRLIVEPYLIFYQLSGSEVLVLRIIHVARDQSTLPWTGDDMLEG